jgi:hypothetical protein
MFDSLRRRIRGRKRARVMQIAKRILDHQKNMISGQDAPFGKARDNYSLGYITGTVDALLQNNNIPMNEVGYSIVKELLYEYVGENEGERLFNRISQLVAQKNDAFLLGVLKGVSDVFTWTANKDSIPMGWVHHAAE